MTPVGKESYILEYMDFKFFYYSFMKRQCIYIVTIFFFWKNKHTHKGEGKEF